MKPYSWLYFLGVFFLVLINTKFFWEVWPLVSLATFPIFIGLVSFTIIYPFILVYFVIRRKKIYKSIIAMGLIFLSGLQLVFCGNDLIDWKKYLENPNVILTAQTKFRGDRSILLFEDGFFIDRFYSYYRVDHNGQFHIFNDSIRFEYSDLNNLNPPIEFAVLLPNNEMSLYLICFFKKPWQSESHSQFLFDVINIDSSYFFINENF